MAIHSFSDNQIKRSIRGHSKLSVYRRGKSYFLTVSDPVFNDKSYGNSGSGPVEEVAVYSGVDAEKVSREVDFSRLALHISDGGLCLRDVSSMFVKPVYIYAAEKYGFRAAEEKVPVS